MASVRDVGHAATRLAWVALLVTCLCGLAACATTTDQSTDQGRDAKTTASEYPAYRWAYESGLPRIVG